VVGISASDGWDDNRALALAAAIEGDSEHLIARAIRSAADERKVTAPWLWPPPFAAQRMNGRLDYQP
jgi:cation transport ATPase